MPCGLTQPVHTGKAAEMGNIQRLLRLALVVGLARRANAQCRRPGDAAFAGYDLSSVTETQLAQGATFDVTGVTCAAGFVGTAAASTCSPDATAYVLSGCAACTPGVGSCTATVCVSQRRPRARPCPLCDFAAHKYKVLTK